MAITAKTEARIRVAMCSKDAAEEIVSALNDPISGDRTNTDSLTAHAGGGQTSATALPTEFNRVTTVTTAADSVKLPAALVGKEITVVNSGANAMQVFGQATETINGIASATGVSQNPGTITTYRSFTAGAWLTTLRLPLTLDNTVTTGTGAMVAGAMEGAEFVTLNASGQAAITLTTRTAAQIQAQVPGWKIGQTYRLRIVNKNTGTLTTAGGSNVTMTSTILANHYADYTVLFATATTITVAQVTIAPVSALNVVGAVGAGYKVARGVHQQAAASDTIVTGLATVVAVVVSFRDTPTAKQSFVTATIGDQAGTPAAGSILVKTFKSTYAAADDFTDNISTEYIALGT